MATTNPAEIENGAVLGQVVAPSGTVGTVENTVQRLRADDTIAQSFGLNGEKGEDQSSELRWSKIRIAAKKYSEDTHADY